MYKIFFAYENATRSGSSINVDAIKNAKATLGNNKKYSITTWEDLKSNGRILINSIFDAINKSDIFACDLTYLNHNVFFELGYAIARNKKLFLLINPQISDAGKVYSKIDILKTVGYSEFNNGQDIINNLNNIPDASKLLEDLSPIFKPENQDIFYIQGSSGSQAELDTLSLLNNSTHKMIFDDPKEIDYRKFAWYISSIQSASNIIVHLTDIRIVESNITNIKASLLAGISCGLNKKTLLLGPVEFKPPIDYTDISISYSNANDCIDKLKIWLKNNVKARSKAINKEDREFNLLKLGLGWEVAETEKEYLSEYFIETTAYTKGKDAQRVFFIGRKGAGKTALYIMLSKELGEDEQICVINLKPESSELLMNIEVTNLYDSIASKSSFFNSIWKFVICSKVILSVYEKLKSKKILYVEETSIEQRISNFCIKNELILHQHFLETIKYVNTSKDENPLQLFHVNYIIPMIKLLQEYLSRHKYYDIAILADNLDKTWNPSNNLSVQIDMLLSLFEVTGIIENDLQKNTGNKIKLRVILFLRQDIFKNILVKANEPDKLILYKHDIDWSAFPDKLKLLIEKRFRYVLEFDDNDNIDTVWTEYFNIELKNQKSVFERLKETCLPRPRDMLIFIRHMFESAVNNGHDKVNEDDFQYALKEYSNFLYQNLIAEMNAEFPNIDKILNNLHEKYYDRIEFERLVYELESMEYDECKSIDILINSLISNEYFIITNMKTGEKYKEFQNAKNSLEKTYKKLFIFKLKPKIPSIYALLTPQYKGRMEYRDISNENIGKRSFWKRIVKD